MLYVRLVSSQDEEEGNETLKRLAKTCRKLFDKATYAVVQMSSEEEAKAAYGALSGLADTALPEGLQGASFNYIEDHSRRRQKTGTTPSGSGTTPCGTSPARCGEFTVTSPPASARSQGGTPASGCRALDHAAPPTATPGRPPQPTSARQAGQPTSSTVQSITLQPPPAPRVPVPSLPLGRAQAGATG